MATNTVTTEQVREAIEQLAAMVVAASISPQTVAGILEMLRNLNDQERLKLNEAAEAYIATIENLGIESEKVSYRDYNVKISLDGLNKNVSLMAKVADSEATSSLDIADDNGFVIARFSGGHLQLKNFDSRNIIKVNVEGDKLIIS